MIKKLKDDKRLLFIVIFSVLAILLILFRFFGSDKEDNDIVIVKSSSKFYTVSNCVYRYLTYLYNKDVDSLILLLDDNYKKNNDINKNNIIDKLDTIDQLYTFEARKMYEQVINSSITKYYVYGYLRVDDINFDYNNKLDYYIIVLVDTENKSFSILPYDGELFLDGSVE